MESTVGGSGGISLDPSLETEREEEKNLETWRLKFLVLQEMGTRLCISDGEGEEYMSEGKDGRPCIKWRRKKTRRGSMEKTEELCISKAEGEEYLSEGEDGRPCIKWRKKKTGKGIKEKIKKTEEKREENEVLYLADGEGEEYMSKGEDGRPCIKWRRKKTTNPAGEMGETGEKLKKAETEAE